MPEGTAGTARRGVAVLSTLLLAVSLSASPAAASELQGDQQVRFEPAPDTQLHLHERGRYAGALELRAGTPDLVVNELGIEDYVAGVAEMPSRWHPEALRAQAVAARTYAWYSIGLDTFDGYDVCATTACQVYRGAGAMEDEDTGQRWLQAVEDTRGEVLLHEGRPILARYFSTSGGRTVANEVAFPTSGPRPYLVGTDDPYDEVSPYHRWTVRFDRDDFDTLLARGDTLAAAVPIAEVERLGEVDDPGAPIRVTGRDGHAVEVDARDLREFLSRVAPDSFPDRYPGRRDDGLRPLPTTVPSSRFAPEVTADEVVLHGQGWGHAVGMGQYGANARAQDGQDHREILAAYYNGLEPMTTEDLPDTIRVGLEFDGPHRVAGTSWFRIVVDGEVAVERAVGTWSVDHDGDAWRVEPPEGHDRPLEVSPTRLGAATTSAAGAATLEVEVNKPVLLVLEVTSPAGQTVDERELGAVDAGTHTTVWRAIDDEGEPLPEGDYRVALMAEDASGASAGSPVAVTVDGADDRGAVVSDDRRSDGTAGFGPPWFVVVAAVAFLLALVTLGAMTRRRPS